MAREAQNGDTVKVHYTGTLDDGRVFDSSRDREPLEFTIGQGQLIPGFEGGMMGLPEGESIKVHIAAVDAYGPHRDDLVATLERSEFPPDMPLKEGMQLQLNQEGAQPLVVMVIDVTDNSVILDANHPLAGQDLNFEIELVEIK